MTAPSVLYGAGVWSLREKKKKQKQKEHEDDSAVIDAAHIQ